MLKNFFITLFSSLLFLPLNGNILRDAAGRAVRRGGDFDPRPVRIVPRNGRNGEFRGVWISTVNNLDFKKVRSAAEFKRQYITMVDRIRAAGFTAVIFQVRPNADAFYPSRLVPYSRWMTGKEGAGFTNFDPLAFMIREAHRRNLEFHAWLNPYRVMNEVTTAGKDYLRTLHPANFARKNPHLVLEARQGGSRVLFFDPGRNEVISHICQVVEDIVRRYDVDAIHFDDYFYPYEEIGHLDDAAYARNNPGRLNKADWRRRNTEKLILNVRLTLNRLNASRRRKVRFGVSPFGIWGNAKSLPGGSATGGKQTYTDLYADTRKWVKMNYLDYIAPQIYWHFGHSTAAYAALVDWWSATVRGTRCKLYIGHAAYRAGENGWGRNELVNQLHYNRMHPEVSGSIFFSYRHLFAPGIKPGVIELFRILRK